MKFLVVLLLGIFVSNSVGDNGCTKKLKGALEKFSKKFSDKVATIPGPSFCPTLKVTGLNKVQPKGESTKSDDDEIQRLMFNQYTIEMDCNIDAAGDVLKPAIKSEVEKFPDYMRDGCKGSQLEDPVSATGGIAGQLAIMHNVFVKKQNKKPENERANTDDKRIHAVMTVNDLPFDVTISRSALEKVCLNWNVKATYEVTGQSEYAKKIATGFKKYNIAQFFYHYIVRYLYEDSDDESDEFAGSLKQVTNDASCL